MSQRSSRFGDPSGIPMPFWLSFDKKSITELWALPENKKKKQLDNGTMIFISSQKKWLSTILTNHWMNATTILWQQQKAKMKNNNKQTSVLRASPSPHQFQMSSRVCWSPRCPWLQSKIEDRSEETLSQLQSFSLTNGANTTWFWNEIWRCETVVRTTR